MPSLVTGKGSAFPALYHAMPVHKQQHLPAQRAFFCPSDAHVMFVACLPLTGNLTQEMMRDHRTALAYPSLVCFSGSFLRLGCRETICNFEAGVTFLTCWKENPIFCGTKAHLNHFNQYKWKIVYSLKIVFPPCFIIAVIRSDKCGEEGLLQRQTGEVSRRQNITWGNKLLRRGIKVQLSG